MTIQISSLWILHVMIWRKAVQVATAAVRAFAVVVPVPNQRIRALIQMRVLMVLIVAGTFHAVKVCA